MIKAQITDTGFFVNGHAGYGEHGKDIVCAGVSAIAQTAILGLQHYGVDMQTEVSGGLIKCKLLSDEREAKPIMQTLALGLEAIAEEFPEHLKLIEGGEYADGSKES